MNNTDVSEITQTHIFARVMQEVSLHPAKEYTVDELATICLKGCLIKTTAQLKNFRRRMYGALEKLADTGEISGIRKRTAFRKSCLVYFLTPTNHV